MPAVVDMRHRPAPERTQTGFALLEVLVSMLIVSVALLGAVALVLHGMRVGQGGQLRGQVVRLANEIAERIETNKTAALAGSYSVASGTMTVSTRDCAAAACTPSELATYDMAAWQNAVAALPGGSSQISVTGAGNPITYSIVIGWVERQSKTAGGGPDSAENLSYTSTRTVGQ